MGYYGFTQILFFSILTTSLILSYEVRSKGKGKLSNKKIGRNAGFLFDGH